jgi:hypothetical protein
MDRPPLANLVDDAYASLGKPGSPAVVDLPVGETVVAFCAHGQEVSSTAAAIPILVRRVGEAINMLALSIAIILTATAAFAGVENFDAMTPGTLPADWICGVTGKGSPVWKVETDTSAPSKPNVLKQSGNGTFPWCVMKSERITDGYVEVKFKPLAGQDDQAGGLVWRFKDGDNYYIARANALENNVSLYHVEKGRRITIKYVNAPVATNQWHILRVEFSGSAIKVRMDDTQYLELNDNHISGAGAVGVWTKADSVTEFDDFSYGGQ